MFKSDITVSLKLSVFNVAQFFLFIPISTW